jgi:8-oxo-dGTP pyrophosphatase MutT (NUDIX family)
MVRFAHRLLLTVFRRLPTIARRWVVRGLYPKYTVGAMCVIERHDGAVLLVRQHYRRAWGTPGGLLGRRECPDDAARREVLEEVGLVVDLEGEPAVVVDERAQRVDIVFRARPATGQASDGLVPRSPEIVEVDWFPADELPELQFETSGALVALARSARSPQSRPLAG